MSRSVSQIYSEAVLRRNNYLQISPLNSGRSESKLSVINILTYVMAVLIHSYEVLLDVFQVQIAQLINKRINGTPAYYATMAEYFQYNSDTDSMDDIEFDDETFQIKFKTLDKSHRIIAKSAYQIYSSLGLVIKVCKENGNPDDTDSNLTPLSSQELTAFKNYMNEIAFVGVKIHCRSVYGDILSVNATIVYDDTYIDEQQAFDNVKAALVNYARNLDFNGYVYYQSVIDAIQSADYITTVMGPDSTSETEKYAIVTLSEYDATAKAYKEAETIVGRSIPFSGYLTFSDETQSEDNTTILNDSTHLIFKPSSSL